MARDQQDEQENKKVGAKRRQFVPVAPKAQASNLDQREGESERTKKARENEETLRKALQGKDRNSNNQLPAGDVRRHRTAVAQLAQSLDLDRGVAPAMAAQAVLNITHSTHMGAYRKAAFEAHPESTARGFFLFCQGFFNGKIRPNNVEDLRVYAWPRLLKRFYPEWNGTVKASRVPSLDRCMEHFLLLTLKEAPLDHASPPVSFRAACESIPSSALRALVSSDGAELYRKIKDGALSSNMPVIDMEGLCTIRAGFLQTTTTSDIFLPASGSHLTHIILPHRRKDEAWSGGKFYRIRDDEKAVEIKHSDMISDWVEAAKEGALAHFSSNNIEPKRMDDAVFYAELAPKKRPERKVAQFGERIQRYVELSPPQGPIPLINVMRIVRGIACYSNFKHHSVSYLDKHLEVPGGTGKDSLPGDDDWDLSESGNMYLDALNSIPALPHYVRSQALKCREDTEKTQRIVKYVVKAIDDKLFKKEISEDSDKGKKRMVQDRDDESFIAEVEKEEKAASSQEDALQYVEPTDEERAEWAQIWSGIANWINKKKSQ